MTLKVKPDLFSSISIQKGIFRTRYTYTLMDDSSYTLNFGLDKKNKIHQRACMLKLVKLQSLAAKCCEMQKI
jgi:hypothetical protein